MQSRSFFTARTDDLVVQELGDELLIYDRRTDVAHCLSEVAAVVWRTCEGGASSDEMVQRMTAQGLAGQGGRVDAEELAQTAASELEEKGLLECHGSRADLISRRHALRRMAGVGMAAVAAPLVVSAAVPKPAEAAGSPLSCRQAGQSCNNGGTVNSGNDCCPNSTSHPTNPPGLYCQTSTQPNGQVCATCTVTGTAPPASSPCNSNNANAPNPACCSGMCGSGTHKAQCG